MRRWDATSGRPTTWKWEDERIVAVSLRTDAYDLADQRPEIFAWKTKGTGLVSTTARKISKGRKRKSAGCLIRPAFPARMF